MKMLTQCILAACLGVVGVTGVVACSETATQESTGQYVDSAATTAKVKAALANTPNLNSTHISVRTVKGEVQLNGSVDNVEQSKLAERAAADVSGVDKVNNNLAYTN